MRHFVFITGLMLFQGLRAQEVQDYIVLGLQNHPELISRELMVKIAEEKADEMNDLPNTEFSVGYFVREPETRTGPQKLRLSVKQMFPWFGTLKLKEDYGRSLAENSSVELLLARKKLVLSISKYYNALWAQEQRIQVLEQNLELLEHLETLGINAVSVGKATAVDILKLQIKKNELSGKLSAARVTLESDKKGFASMLNLPDTMAISIKGGNELPQTAMSLSPDSLFNHPEILRFEAESHILDQSIALSKKERSPGLGIGLDYVTVNERTDMQVPDNGKDIVMPMVSMSIPLFGDRYRSADRQFALKRQQIEASRTDVINKLKAVWFKAIADQRTARITFDTQKANLLQARDTETLLLQNYATQMVGFEQVLQIQELKLDLEMKQIEALRSYMDQEAQLQYLTL